MANISVSDLRSLLRRIEDQSLTIAELRLYLTLIDDQSSRHTMIDAATEINKIVNDDTVPEE